MRENHAFTRVNNGVSAAFGLKNGVASGLLRNL
jgi:hypothetical protein